MDCFGWLTSTDTLGIVAFPQETVDTTDGECEASLGRAAVCAISIDSRSKQRRVFGLNL